MNILEIISNKRDGKSLSRNEISFLIRGYCNGEITDSQISALLMAIYIRGMQEKELLSFTKEMMQSGKTVNLEHIKAPKVDKHSTGGVGDKVSLIVAPMVASLGVVVPMIAGRALGHTGGTLDKLESIPGFRTDLSLEDFKSNLEKIGVAITGQTAEIVPADKKIYALREATATVESIPLIASSIMSKKLAGGCRGLLLDIKVGAGAFMKRFQDAKQLAETLVSIGKGMGVDTVGIITGMDEPLGRYIGNSLEVMESIEVLTDKGDERLRELCFEIGAWMLKLSGLTKTINDGKTLCKSAIKDGRALEKFKNMVKLQSGDDRIADKPEILPVAPNRYELKSFRKGYIAIIDSFVIGNAVRTLGAGRINPEDKIDHSVGIFVNKGYGEMVKEGEPIFIIYYNNEVKLNETIEKLTGAIIYSKVKPVKRPLIYGIIT